MNIPRNDMRQAMQAYGGHSPDEVKEEEMKFCHVRNFDAEGNVSPKGGTTIAYINAGHGIYRFAVAKCAPEDTYNKKYGRAKAGGKLQSPKHAQIVDKIKDVGDLVMFVLNHRREM